HVPAPAVDDLRQVNRGFPLAALAYHVTLIRSGVSSSIWSGLVWPLLAATPHPSDQLSPRLLLQGADLVTDPRGGFVVLRSDGPLQFVAELDHGRLLLAVLGCPLGNLTRMARLVVDVFQERHELVAKHLIVVRTAEASRVAELEECDLADGT